MGSEIVEAPLGAATGGELRCPLCDYDLRATSENRCPECGYHFDPAELRDPTRRVHPFAFEHHAERNIWAFLCTLLAGLWPRALWKGLFPTQPSRPRRLVLYWLIVTGLCLLPFALIMARAWASVDASMRSDRRVVMASWARMKPESVRQYIGDFPTTQAYLAAIHPEPTPLRIVQQMLQYWQDTRAFALVCALWIIWPWATFVLLMIFQASMRRAAIKRIHVLRCVLYTADVALWMALLLIAILAVDIARNGWVFSGGFIGSHRTRWTLYLAGASLLLYTLRLASAYRHYLRFDFSFATALSTQVILLLAWMILAVNLIRWGFF